LELFELTEMIGTGSYGSVFQCREVKSGKLYAIKFLELDAKQNEIVDIINEINILKASMGCPYIVEYVGCYMKNDMLMVVMEYCCCSMEDVIEYCEEIKLTELQVAAVCAGIVKALVWLHSNSITHRDIKSGNVLLKETGEVKLADFGISHKLKHERDKMKTFIGSPYWLAPEIITHDSYNNKVDIWGLGISAIEIAESKPPLWDIDPQKVIFQIPQQPPPKLTDGSKWSEDFADFLDKCLRKNPDERTSAKELLYHPFILKGSSSQILQPLVKQCLPILLPRKQEDLEEDEDCNEFAHKGTILAFDKRTFQADIVQSNSLLRNKAKEKE